MKFGKEFKKQKVPEWTEAYVDYNGLKRILHEIHRIKQSKLPPAQLRASQQRSILCRTFSGLNLEAGNLQNLEDIENPAIAVNTVQQENCRKLYNTELLVSPEEVEENEINFFRKLDNELNKANTFYKDKVEGVVREAALLNTQMDALVALRIKVMDPSFHGSSSLRHFFTNIDYLFPSKVTSPSRAKTSGVNQMGTRLGVKMSCNQQEPDSPSVVEHMNLTPEAELRCQGKESDIHSESDSAAMAHCFGASRDEANSSEWKPTQLEILDRVKISNNFENPISTIKGVFKDSKEKDLSFKKEELREVEERLKHVFVEFYHKLRLLKNYSFMNLSAFSKILKKYEKITSRRAARSYMKIVDNSYIGSSDEVSTLMDRVEVTFIKHFSNSNRREGMKLLRPKQRREKHRITFFSGFFSGCSIALLIAVILLIEDRKSTDKENTALYLGNIFPLYSFYAYIVLHVLVYAADIYFWRRYNINYPFIFGFKQGTELSYREVFLLSNGLAMLSLGTFLVHLYIKMDSRKQDYKTCFDFLPLGLLIVVLFIVFCPFSILYHSSRFFLIKCVFHCICAPLYEVTLPDFFLADQLTSQVQAIRSLEYYICFYTWKESSWRRTKCSNHDAYNIFYFIVAVIPYWFRFLQCARRFFEEKDIAHGYNGLRYFFTIVAVVIRTAFELKKQLTWQVLALVSSVIATMFNTYWDIFVDWGLLQRKSKNLFLRDKLLVSHKSVYFAAMVLDILLRFAWLQVVLIVNVHSLRGTTISSIFSCLEIIRRGMWNFFRLENEHLNNVGKYRAFKSVPLPFNYYDVDDEDEDDKDD